MNATNKPQNFSKTVSDMISNFPTQGLAVNDAFRTSAVLGEKMSKVTLDAVEKSAEISNKWTKEALAEASHMTSVKDDPAEYTKALADFTSASAEIASEHMSAFAEVFKKVQMQTIELLLSTGKDLSNTTVEAVKKTAKGSVAADK